MYVTLKYVPNVKYKFPDISVYLQNFPISIDRNLVTARCGVKWLVTGMLWLAQFAMIG